MNESYHSNSIRSYYHNDFFDSVPFQWNCMKLIVIFPQRHDSFHDFQSMSISCNKKETDPSLVIDGVETESADDIKFLGITVDQCLIFNMHISYMWTKAGWQPNMLQILRSSLNFNSGTAIYQTFKESNTNDCPSVSCFQAREHRKHKEGNYIC